MKDRRHIIIPGLRVEADGDNFEKMLRKFKKKVENDGKMDLLAERITYTKPSVARRLAHKKAVARQRREQTASLNLNRKRRQ